MAPLLDEEIDELDKFLLSDATSDENMVMSGLDGYFTAIVIGPKTVMPSLWLRKSGDPRRTTLPNLNRPSRPSTS